MILKYTSFFLFHIKYLKKCSECHKYISIHRQEAVPGTTFCSPSCEYDMSPTSEAVERAAKAEKEYLERIKKEQISQKVLINTLFEKRGTMISALKSLNNGSITKSDYEKKFKQFTWWIKGEVEKMGRHIIDNSANYVDCPDCSHPVLVL